MKRIDLKQKTRDLILKETSLLCDEYGFYKISTKDISNACNLSQGSIFLHFQSKQNLLNIIFFQLSEYFEKNLEEKCSPNLTQDIFFKNFLDVLIESENFLSRVYKDLPYLNDSIKKHISGLETTIKNLFFDNIREKSKGKINIVDTFIGIDAIYSQIHCNLIEKEVYTSHNSILKQRRGKLVKLYRTLFG